MPVIRVATTESTSEERVLRYRTRSVDDDTAYEGESTVKSEGCDVIFCPVSIAYSTQIVNQAASLNISLPMLGSDTWDDNMVLQAAKGKDVKVTKRSETTYTFQMPDSKVTVEAAFAKEGTVVDQPLFSDVSKNDYFHDAVEWAVDKGITSGTGGTTFSPNASCTRGQMVTFLWRAAGSPAPKSAETPFTDVNKAILLTLDLVTANRLGKKLIMRMELETI